MKSKQAGRWLAFFLVILIALLSGHAGAAIVNGQWVIFTIANDELLPLSYNTMPYMYNSSLYVPYSVFTEYLGLRSVYNAEEEILILGNSDQTLFYDMKNGNAYDDNDYGYAREALVYNGYLYVPAKFTAEFFGFSYYYDYEIPVVRLYDSTAAMTDTYIKNYYEQEFQKRLETYQEAPPEEPDPETATPAPFYLMFAGDLNDHTNAILDLLDKAGVRAIFFLSAEAILENEALVRRIYVDGHLLGLSAPSALPESPESLVNAYAEANAALFQVLRRTERRVYLPGGSLHEIYDTSYFDALKSAGYEYWDFTVIANDYQDYASGTEVCDAIIESLISGELVQTVVMHSTQAAEDALPSLLSYIEEREGVILSPDELTSTITF